MRRKEMTLHISCGYTHAGKKVTQGQFTHSTRVTTKNDQYDSMQQHPRPYFGRDPKHGVIHFFKMYIYNRSIHVLIEYRVFFNGKVKAKIIQKLCSEDNSE